MASGATRDCSASARDHSEKVLFPDGGISKGELAAYYEAVAPLMLPHLRGRPVTMERYPSGIDKKGFIQKDVSKGYTPDLALLDPIRKHILNPTADLTTGHQASGS